MLNSNLKIGNYWIMRNLILFCFILSALFFILPNIAQAILCGPDWELFYVQMGSINVSGNELIIVGTLDNGTCTQHCGSVEIPNGIWAIAGPLGYLQYQIDNTSDGGWIDLEQGAIYLGGQWEQTRAASPASPMCSVENTMITPAAYLFDTSVTPILLTGTQLNPGVHTLYLKQFFDLTQNGYDSFNYSIPSADFDFTLSPSPSSGMSRMGASVSSTILVTKTVGTASAVSFSATSSPSGPTATFSPSSCTPSISTCTTTMTVNPNGSPDGTYTITVSGTTGLTTRATIYTLQVSNNPVDILIRQGGTTNPFSNGPITINSGGAVDLQWVTNGAGSCSAYATPANGLWSGAVPLLPNPGSRTITGLTTSTNFELRCSTATAYHYTGTYETEIGDCSLPEQSYAFRIYNTVGDGISYRINGGTWTNLTQGSQWTQTSGFCADGCVEGVCVNIYQIDFFTPNLAVGSYILELRYRIYDTRFKNNYYEQGPQINFTVSEFSDTVTANINRAPDIPALVGPPNGSYVNAAAPDPAFQATVTDFDTEQSVFAHFQVVGVDVVGFGENDGNFTTTPGTSAWGPVAGIEDGTYVWRAYAEDSVGATSSWSEYWSFTKDTMLPYASISYPLGNYDNTVFRVYLIELDERTSVVRGDVQMRSRLISGTWSVWGAAGLPNNGTTMVDFDFTGTRGYEYEFQYRATDGAGNVSDWVSPGTVTIAANVSPTATGLSFSTTVDICGASSGYFFSWTYSDGDGDPESRYEFEIDDNSDYSSPVVSTFNDNPQSVDNGVAVPIRPTIQPGNLTYNNTRYYWHVRVYDNQIPPNASGWVNGTALTTPSHHLPDCIFTWLPTSPNLGESVNFIDSSICYDASGNTTPCISWNWTFTDGNPATSTQQNPTAAFATSGSKNVILQIIDSFGSTCSITRLVVVGLPLPKWREIRPW